QGTQSLRRRTAQFHGVLQRNPGIPDRSAQPDRFGGEDGAGADPARTGRRHHRQGHRPDRRRRAAARSGPPAPGRNRPARGGRRRPAHLRGARLRRGARTSRAPGRGVHLRLISGRAFLVMREPGTLRLFKRGPSIEVRLVMLLVLCLGMAVTDAHWSVLGPVRSALSMVLYPFQRVVLAPRDALEYFDSWSQAAALARDEQEALRRQRIEMAQLSTHAAQLAAENEQLRRLLNVSESIAQQSVAVEVFYVPSNAFSHRLIFNKGSRAGIAPGMPVIDEGGVVGQIVRVTPFTSEAAL